LEEEEIKKVLAALNLEQETEPAAGSSKRNTAALA